MKNFLQKVYDTGLLPEQADPSEFGNVPEPTSAEPTEEITTTLSPEAEVMYIRLLKKAMVMKLDPEDLDDVADLADVNEMNAKDVFSKILQTMKSYSTEIDIDV